MSESGGVALRCVYLDLDATLLGRGASLLHDGEGRVSLAGVRAVEACLRAGVEVVLMSGRRRAQVAEDARLLGQTAYIFEAGAGLVLDGEEHWLTGEWQPGERTIAEQIDASGAVDLVLTTFPGRLEYHAPFHRDREVSRLLRGLVDVDEANAALAAAGHSDLRLLDNGIVTSRSPDLAALPFVRGYHLVPASVSKVGGVVAHRRARGYERAVTIAVGDSREDLGCAPEVGCFWLVANGLERDPSIRDAMAGIGNVRVAEHGYGAGVYEAVVSTLMGG